MKKSIGPPFCLLLTLILICAPLFTSCAKNADGKQYGGDTAVTESTAATDSGEEQKDTPDSGEEEGVFPAGTYDEVYSSMLSEIEKHAESITYKISGECDADFYIGVFNHITAEHPELFWLKGNCVTTTTTINDVPAKVEIKPEVFLDTEESEVKKEELEAEVERIKNSVPADADDFDIAEFLYDLLDSMTEYNEEAGETFEEGSLGDDYYKYSSAYAAIVSGDAICAGYSAAYQLLANSCGLECVTLSGTGNGGPHSWNAVKIDGEWYQCDPTWDDNDEAGTQYRYFLLTDEEMYADHVLDTESANENLFVPECNSDRYNYYVHKGYYLEEYSFDAVSEIITRQLEDGKTARIRFADENSYKDATEDLLENGRIFDIPSVSGNKISYIDSCPFLTVFIK